MRLVLLRHGRTDWNHQNRLQGMQDVELNDVGREQALLAAPHVAALEPDVIFSSDLCRAVDTAAAVAALCGLPVVTDPRLREINVGDWSGRTWAEVKEAEPEAVAAINRDQDVRYGRGGERPSEVAERFAGALEDLASRFDGGTLLVVSHGMAIRLGVARLLGMDVAQGRLLGGIGNCGWSILDQRPDGRWRLTAYNRLAPEVAGT